MPSEENKRAFQDLERELRIIAYGQAELSLRQQGVPINHEAVKAEVKRIRSAYAGREVDASPGEAGAYQTFKPS